MESATATGSTKRERTRELLRTTALRLFDERGFDAVTAEQIASAAGMTRATFFRAFPSKTAVLDRDDERRRNAYLDLLRNREHGEAEWVALREAALELARVEEPASDSDRYERIIVSSTLLMGKAFQYRVAWLRGMEQILREDRGTSSDAAAVLADVCLGLMETGLRLHAAGHHSSTLFDTTAAVFATAEHSLEPRPQQDKDAALTSRSQTSPPQH